MTTAARRTQQTVPDRGDMLPRTSIATVCLSGTLDEKLDAAAAAGFDGVEIFEPDLVASPFSPHRIASAAADRGLSIDLYQPFRDLDSADDERFARNLIRLERKFDLMDALGCDLLLVCSSPLPGAVADDARLVAQLGAAAEVARHRGKRLAYEALAWGTHVNDYRHAARLVAAVGDPVLGNCLDSFHILSRGDDPAGIAEMDADSMFFLQLADAPAMRMDLLQWSRHHRCLPGQGNFDLATFIRAVQASGYRGPWSLEVFSDLFRHADAGRTARDAHRSLRYLAEIADETGAGPIAGAAADAVPAGGVVGEPPLGPAAAGDIVSVRVAAGPVLAPRIAECLSYIGFDLQGVDSVTGLRLYRDADIAVVVDATAGTVWTAPGVPADMPTIAQIGLRSDNPAAWEQRAADFDVAVAPVPAPGTVAPVSGDEVVRLDVTETLAIDLRAVASASEWQERFDLVPRRAEPPSKLFTGVDHVGLGIPTADWEGAMLLLRSVFGMRVDDGLDIPDAVGTMRSQALTLPTSSGSAVRIVASMVPTQLDDHGPLRRPGGLTHAAFACDDIFDTARRCRARGLRALPIPDNYYDDLIARFDLSDAMIEQMRTFDVLYDADDDGGEFFHFFTPTVGEDLFFEIVCRRNGYRGYGEVNSPARVAAELHRRAVDPTVAVSGSGP
ncbi:sugar phosphate isomerase/epimerase and 4-hydroxyphenylpyruvate domain-containing protein [Streptomyces sp. SID6673]|nr:sugar phosphate isomerase/epimerase and 4-hydroxyphenylpyruvate domain-containing protein [Streptomyces sp. SID11726]NEB25114.1 sugar phosphate isomerase/epimerase and 4-hydroxyphenylpyruvate domain-containing protein [Streptomyces sp. SID6673]